ncbi:hypothetical protein CKK33_08165 [Mucilaginibacter sp. MD40]|uniref:exosortase Y n=1 Tax=Mucilaginibacter sp. MD40 TaxID=2029590 RepID=UPI000BAC82BE|nr:archaeosortase/exosortase family protein [Mucilaginibacter sp. MD40]PAW93467.1 hypothetical protein CKK33_08165 [Mucilaginibacter sp. MD40]
MKSTRKKINPAIIFIIKFLLLFGAFYGFYLLYLGVVSPGGYYNAYLDEHFNFINAFRTLLIGISSDVLNLLGYQTKTSAEQMLVVGHNIVHIGYDCLGIAVMCFFAAFVIAYPATLRTRLIFGFAGILCIQLLNIIRIVLLSLYWKHNHAFISDHHTIFNIVVYLLIGISIYFYIRHQDKQPLHAAN